MRLTYIFAVVIVGTLYAGGNALFMTKESNHRAISNTATTNVVHSHGVTQEDGGRLLRRVEKKNLEGREDAIDEEERSFKSLAKSLAKRIPGTEAWKKRRFAQNARAEAVRRQTLREKAAFAKKARDEAVRRQNLRDKAAFAKRAKEEVVLRQNLRDKAALAKKAREEAVRRLNLRDNGRLPTQP